MTDSLPVSIIMPVLNEAAGIVATLTPLQALRRDGHEVVVVDGGSTDDSWRLVEPLVDRILLSAPGRGRQLNVGAAAASHDVLLFLHADTRLPEQALNVITHGLQQSGRGWGRFDVRLSGAHPLLRMVEQGMNWRSRITAICTGDQALFMSREAFECAGGYADIPLMEDLVLSRSLKRHGRPLCLRERVITSSRRWEQGGILRTILLMWRLRLAWFLGADPHNLARQYRLANP